LATSAVTAAAAAAVAEIKIPFYGLKRFVVPGRIFCAGTMHYIWSLYGLLFLSPERQKNLKK
jgi:hypothetical protein